MVNERPIRSMSCKQHAELALELSEELLVLATQEHEECDHTDCLLFDGIVRDCAHAVRQAALERRRELVRTRPGKAS